MKTTIEKVSIIGVAALFLTVSIMPMIAAQEIPETETTSIEIASVQNNGLLQTETFQLTTNELASLIEQLTRLTNLIDTAKDQESIGSILLDFINGNTNPIIAKIIDALLSSKMDFDRQLVVSAGWGLTLNPFKKTETDFVKPIAFWHYAEKEETMQIPSITATLNMNPFQVKSMMGSQFGIMLRFRGVHVHIPQKLPQQSFTFFIGSAKHVINVELPTIQIPEIPTA